MHTHLKTGTTEQVDAKSSFIKSTDVQRDTIKAGWDETRFLGRDRDRVIRGVEFLYETETEKFYLEDYSTRPRPRNSIYKFVVRE